MSRLSRIPRWLRLALGLVAGAAVLLWACGGYFAVPLLCEESPRLDGQAIVVLGGDVTQRPARAVEIFQQCAPAVAVVLVSGAGDTDEVKRYLEAKGVPAGAIEVEEQSRNTKQNAEFSVKLLRQRQVKRAIIVTSWFHTRRALNCFRHFAPEIEFAAAPTVADRPEGHWPEKGEQRRVLLEYVKLAYYWPRYGIAPL